MKAAAKFSDEFAVKASHPERRAAAMDGNFILRPHLQIPGKNMVEYWRDGKFVASSYFHGDGIRIVSKFITGAGEDPVYPQAVIVKLEGC